MLFSLFCKESWLDLNPEMFYSTCTKNEVQLQSERNVYWIQVEKSAWLMLNIEKSDDPTHADHIGPRSFGSWFGPHEMEQHQSGTTNLSGPKLEFPSTTSTLKTRKQTFFRRLFSLQTGKRFPQTCVQASALLPSSWVLSSYCKLRLNRVRWQATRSLKGNSISSGSAQGLFKDMDCFVSWTFLR